MGRWNLTPARCVTPPTGRRHMERSEQIRSRPQPEASYPIQANLSSDFRSSDLEVLLRTARSLCRAVHSALWAKPVAPSVNTFPFPCRPRPAHGGGSALFQEDLLARNPFASTGGLFDRMGGQRIVVDVDGTRQTARQRVLPQVESLPAPHRRFDQVCAPGYQGSKRGGFSC